MKRWKRHLLFAHLVGSYLFFPLDYLLWRFLSNAEMAIDIRLIMVFLVAPVSVPGMLACLALWYLVDPDSGPSLLLLGTSWMLYLTSSLALLGLMWGSHAFKRSKDRLERRDDAIDPRLKVPLQARLSEITHDAVL